MGFIITAAVAAFVYYGIGWIKPTFGEAAAWIIAVILVAVYTWLIWIGSRHPELELDVPEFSDAEPARIRTYGKIRFAFLIAGCSPGLVPDG